MLPSCNRTLTFSFLVLFGILTVRQGVLHGGSVMLFPGTQTLSLGLSPIPAPVPDSKHLIGCRGVNLPSDVRGDFSDWLSVSLVMRVRQDFRLPSPATKHLQPDDTQLCLTTGSDSSTSSTHSSSSTPSLTATDLSKAGDTVQHQVLSNQDHQDHQDPHTHIHT